LSRGYFEAKTNTFSKTYSIIGHNMSLEGERRPSPLTRRLFMTGGIAAGGMLLIQDGMRNRTTAQETSMRQQNEARNEARKAIEAQGVSEPTAQEIDNMVHVSNEIASDPLRPTTEIMEEAKRHASKVRDAVKKFNNEYQISINKIHAEQGSPEIQRLVGAIELSTGGAGLVFSYPLASAFSDFRTPGEKGLLARSASFAFNKALELPKKYIQRHKDRRQVDRFIKEIFTQPEQK
jgi:hypothetical protein